MSEAETTTSGEQAADLAALTKAAREDAPAPDTTDDQAQPEQLQQPSAAAMQIAAMAVGMARPLIAFAVPALREAPDKLWEPVPEGLAAVLDHYGASAEWLNSPWARLAFSLAPLAAFAAMQSMSKPKPVNAIAGPDLSAPAPTGAASSKEVIIGAPMPAEAAA